jgi:Outer membrane protein beta-barrel domain
MASAGKVVARYGAAVLCVAAVSPAFAFDSKLAYKLGYDGGGEALVTVTFASGETDNIKSNRGLFFGGGVSIVNDAKDLETEITLSYKFDSITASNGDVTFSRLPLDGLVFYRTPSVRVGGGVTYHLNPDLSGSGVAGGLNVNFKNSLGLVAQVDWRLSDNVNLGLRYTKLDYDVEGSSGSVKSNGIGIVLSGRL